MNNNIRIGNLFGIPFYINPSWFLILGLVTLTYGSDLARFPGLDGIIPWILGLFVALCLFSSVVAHELGHSLVAIWQGIKVRSITLFLFGGLAALEEEAKTPTGSLLIAIAGPLVSLLLFGIFSAINSWLNLIAPAAAIVSLLAYINLALALFNLIPGLPLDGGNVLKAIVWKITKNPNKGVIVASRIGQLFGWLAVIIGILGMINLSPVGNFWTLLIGTFLLQNAGFSAQSAVIQDKLSQYTAGELVLENSPVISRGMTIREFVNEYVIGKNTWRKFLVVDADKHLVGAILVEDLKQIPTSDWTKILIDELVKPVDEDEFISDKSSLLAVVQQLEKKPQLQQLIVRNEAGEILGLIEKQAIIDVLQKKTA